MANNLSKGVALPESGVDTTTREITDSWAQIQQAASLGVHATRYQLGDTKPFVLADGTEVVMQIVTFDEDDKADGSGKAAISWISRDSLAPRQMYSTHSPEGGWVGTETRAWLQGDFFASLPYEVRNAIVKVNKTHCYGENNDTLTCEDTLWIPSHREIFGGTPYEVVGQSSGETSGADYSSFFSSESRRIKNYNDTAISWWLRTTMQETMIGGFEFLYIYKEGYETTGWSVLRTIGVVFGFCTDASNIAPAPIDPTSFMQGWLVGRRIAAMTGKPKEEV